MLQLVLERDVSRLGRAESGASESAAGAQVVRCPVDGELAGALPHERQGANAVAGFVGEVLAPEHVDAGAILQTSDPNSES